METPNQQPIDFCSSCMQNVKPCSLGGLFCDNVQTDTGFTNVINHPIITIAQPTENIPSE